jgi:phage baseplate assembly protein W
MPIPQVNRVNPLDLQKNIAIGVGLPFNRPSAFRSVYSTKDQIKYNLINLLLTNKGERINNPEFGADIKKELFEQIDDEAYEGLKEKIINSVNTFVPQVTLIKIVVTPFPDTNTIAIGIEYSINISGEKDNIKINFE